MINMQNKVISAVNSLISNDSELLELDAHEQSLSHRMGVYLEEAFKSEKLNIDCEYNKHLERPKTINLRGLDPQSHNSCNCDACRAISRGDIEEILEKSFRPDIVIHMRGSDARNLIAIEVKKDNECPFDEEKLKALTTPLDQGGEYGYALGAFIWFPQGVPRYKWFIAGIAHPDK